MDETENLIGINISGQVFQVSSNLLLRKPETRLGRLACDAIRKDSRAEALVINKNGQHTIKSKTAFYNRSISAFEAIILYYQTDELHIPSTMCPKAFKRELDFWEIGIQNFGSCCRYTYLEFLDNCEIREKFKLSMTSKKEIKEVAWVKKTSGRQCRAKLWSLLEHKESSWASEITRIFLITCVLVSIITIAVNTVESTKQELNTCELSDYLKSVGYDEEVIEILHESNCTSLKEFEEDLKAFIIYLAESENTTDQDTIGILISERKNINRVLGKLLTIDKITKRHVALTVIDFVLVSVFTVELFLRLCSCPSFKRYFYSILNIVDIVVLASSYIELVLSEVYIDIEQEDKGIKILYYLQIFRVFRILRFVQNIPSIRVLSHTIIANLKDLMVLFLYILIAVMIFANFVYFCEDKSNFPNIFEAWWWAIITMTTVGYGDIAPKTAIGKVIGSVCALTGVLVLALIIPVIANSFMTLYQFSHLYTKDEFLMKDINQSNRIVPFPNENEKKQENVEETLTCDTLHIDKQELKEYKA